MKSGNSSVVFLLVSMTALLFTFSGCKKNDDFHSIETKFNSLTFDYDQFVFRYFPFSNITDKTISWFVSSPDDFVYFNQESGTLDPNSTADLDVMIHRDLLSGDSISSQFQISSSEGDIITVSLTIFAFPEEMIRLGYQIRDAVFSKNTNKLYMLASDDTHRFIGVFDATEKSIERIEFTTEASFGSMTISTDEKLLGIYDGSRLMTLNLADNQFSEVYYFPDQISSVVFAPGQKVYIFKNLENSIGIYCLDLNNGHIKEFSLDNIEPQMFIPKLHPSGKYIYASSNNFYSEFLKISLTDTIPTVVYQEDVEDLIFNFWFSPDGSKILFQSKNYFNINPDMPGYDIIGTGSLSFDYDFVYDMSYNLQKHEQYIIPLNNDPDFGYFNRVLVYDKELSLKETIVTEDFTHFVYSNSNQGEFAYSMAIPQYVFSTKNGDHLIMVVTSDNREHYAYGSAIQIVSR
jgi:hypothetical protein